MVLKVNLSDRSYDIVIKKDSIKDISKLVDVCGKKVAIVMDDNVSRVMSQCYGGASKLLFDSGATSVHEIVFKEGESSKNFNTLAKIYEELASFKVTRTDRIIALGGGVVGDITGLAAATMLRGIPYIQVPTTLLAQVDSSVGGKVAVNLSCGKNLVGAFYQPTKVIIDTNVLSTLTPRVFNDGMAEVIKYGAISDAELFKNLSNAGYVRDNLDEIVRTCCDIKRSFVENDEFDTGNRMILNFGHTVGHGIEQYYNYERYTHGEAVAIGMCVMARVGALLGITSQSVHEEIERVAKVHNLPTRLDQQALDGVISAMSGDKKADGALISIILLNKIGQACIHKLKMTELAQLVRRVVIS